jgi:multidrug efflux pump subunit AcrB
LAQLAAAAPRTWIVVAWFQSFRVPLLIMAPIRLTLVGILPVHAFTARSIIGFIVGAGIIVRDSSMRLETSFQAGEKLPVARHSLFRATSASL